jgi:hypothetical protein
MVKLRQVARFSRIEGVVEVILVVGRNLIASSDNSGEDPISQISNRDRHDWCLLIAKKEAWSEVANHEAQVLLLGFKTLGSL